MKSLHHELDEHGFKSWGMYVNQAFHPSRIDKLVPASAGVESLVRLQARRMGSLAVRI
jgi:hypothetical protein